MWNTTVFFVPLSRFFAQKEVLIFSPEEEDAREEYLETCQVGLIESWIYGSWIQLRRTPFGIVMTWSNPSKNPYQLITDDRCLSNLDTYLDECPENQVETQIPQRILANLEDFWSIQPTKPTNELNELIARCVWIIATKTSQYLGCLEGWPGQQMEWLSTYLGSWSGIFHTFSRWWWFQILFYMFFPLPGEMIQFWLYHIFRWGWNHNPNLVPLPGFKMKWMDFDLIESKDVLWLLNNSLIYCILMIMIYILTHNPEIGLRVVHGDIGCTDTLSVMMNTLMQYTLSTWSLLVGIN